MKILRLILSNSQQFNYLDLDFTYPEDHKKSGQPLDKVCFIGENGSGKTTLLNWLFSFAIDPFGFKATITKGVSSYYILFFTFNSKYYMNIGGSKFGHFLLKLNEKQKLALGIMVNLFKQENITKQQLDQKLKQLLIQNTIDAVSKLKFEYSKESLQISSPADSRENQFLKSNIEQITNLNQALPLLNNIVCTHIISNDYIKNFWELFIYQIKKREVMREEFEKKEENLDKTKRQLIEEFEAIHPDFLKVLSDEWNIILKKAGLFFDYEEAIRPMQLTDNLKAYIKSDKNRQIIGYNLLSTGIRHLILRFGYLKALFFQREIKHALCFIDEPENSLFPNLLYDIIPAYERITEGDKTQLFFATHNPIIASQFDPAERFILKFNDNGFVRQHKGKAPEGDDPNDLLLKDFGLETLLSREGKVNLERFIELKTIIKNETDKRKKHQYMNEYFDIGNKYNFLQEEYEKNK